MSHYTVLVVGEDPEGQLEPYDEHLILEEYSYPISEESKQQFIDHYFNEFPEETDSTFAMLYEKYGIDWNGNNWRVDENNEWREYSTYNKQCKWDWYQIGGRWTGFFKLKSGTSGELGEKSMLMAENVKEGYADQALKKDIDFDGMREEARLRASERYTKIQDIFNGEIPKIMLKWETIVNDEAYQHLTIEQKRDLYHYQVAMVKQRDAIIKYNKEVKDKNYLHFDIADFQISIDEYVQNAGKYAIMTHSLLIDGEWFERGKMGWFGVSYDIMDENEWIDKYNDIIDNLHDDTLLTVVDCHI